MEGERVVSLAPFAGAAGDAYDGAGSVADAEPDGLAAHRADG